MPVVNMRSTVFAMEVDASSTFSTGAGESCYLGGDGIRSPTYCGQWYGAVTGQL
jgi:hypothetical protein